MKLFVREHGSCIVLHLLQFLFLYSTFRWLDAGMVERNIAYLFLVSLFMLAVHLALRYAASRGGYRWLSRASEWEDPRGFMRMDAASPLFRAFRDGLARQYRLMQREREIALQEEQERIEFMNRSVHLMKTPVSALHLIAQDLGDPDAAADMLQEIHRLEYQLNLILTLSRLSSFRHDFRIRPVPLLPLVREAVNELRSHFVRRQIYPSVDVDEELRVLSDRKWLKFVIAQLLTNAIRYTDGAGKRVFVRAMVENGRTTLSVKDEGVGIPPEDLPRVFDLYYTGANGRKFGESTGIGLYLVRNICGRLDHEVAIASSPGAGTEVTIRFPASPPEGERNVTNL
jgi:signal transduction histidine kinase